MRKVIVLGTALILLQIPLLAYLLLQERTWGGLMRDGAQGVAVDGNGNVYVTGSMRRVDPISGFEHNDAILLKYSAAGVLLWQRTYGNLPDPDNSASEAGIAVAVTGTTGVVVVGNYSDGNIFLAKFTPDGDKDWERTWGANREAAGGIAIATTGTIYVTGSSFDVGNGDAFLLSFTDTGTLNWQRTWGGSLFERGLGVAVATDGNIFITGDTQLSGNSAHLVKFAPDGLVLQQIAWGFIGKGGFPEDDMTVATAVAAAPNGGAYVVGDTTGTGLDPNLVAVRFDSGANFVWSRVGGPGFGGAQTVAVGSNGNVNVAGTVISEDGFSGDAFVWTLSANGKGEDAAVWGGIDQFEGEHAQSIAVAPNLDVVVVGSAGPPPYTFARGSKGAKAASAFREVVEGIVTDPAKQVGMPTTPVNPVVGSETFAGESDAFLLRVQP